MYTSLAIPYIATKKKTSVSYPHTEAVEEPSISFLSHSLVSAVHSTLSVGFVNIPKSYQHESKHQDVP